MKRWRQGIRVGVGGGLFAAILFIEPQRWCGREAAGWYAGSPELQQKLARGVEEWVQQDLDLRDYSTGSAQFNGEWLFGTYLMAGLGFGQTAQEHPEWKERHLAIMARCLDRMLSPEVRAFDRDQWAGDPLETLDQAEHHAAYLGYLNLLLSFHRQLDPDSRFKDLNDRITAALVRRLEASPILMLQSYPAEIYPVDNCAVIGSLGLYDRATGRDHSVLIRKWSDRCRRNYRDGESGLLYQALGLDGEVGDHPRGSGTSLGLYFLSFADARLARELYTAMRNNLAGGVFGLGAMREYPRGIRGGRGDIDSGPVILGYSFSATGFSLAGSRMFGDRKFFRKLYATAYFAGAPYDQAGRRRYVTGGPLGSAILFAMLTARPPPGEPAL